jgi:hypothetical protein
MSEKKTAIVTEELQGERYAVIKARWSEVFSEYFVIAYREEESLHELIAPPSIIGIGFSPRQAAIAVIPNRSSRNADSKNIREKRTFSHENDHRGAQPRRQRPGHTVGLTETRRIACAILQRACATVVLLFYSRSVLGAAIRAFLAA